MKTKNIKKIAASFILLICLSLSVAHSVALAADDTTDSDTTGSDTPGPDTPDSKTIKVGDDSATDTGQTQSGAQEPTPTDTKKPQDESKKTPPSIPDTFPVTQYLTIEGQSNKVAAGGIMKFIVDVIDLLVKIIGSLALIVFIVGALLTIVSEGKEDRLEKGKTAMLYAIYGIVISLMAFVIVAFVQSIFF